MHINVMVHVSPFKHFGSGWGETINNTLNIYCNADGFYNIQVVGTRDDPMMEEEYLNNPVEYKPKHPPKKTDEITSTVAPDK